MQMALMTRSNARCLPSASGRTSFVFRSRRVDCTKKAAARRSDTLKVRCSAEQEEGESVTEEEAVQVEVPTTPSVLERIRELLDDETRQAVEALLSEIEEEMEGLKAGVAEAEARATASEAESGTLKDQYLRLNADFDNYRKRSASEKESISAKAQGEVVEMLLPIVDNFELAKNQIQTNTEEEEKIDRSYQGIYKQIVEVMKNLGVVPVNTVGSRFDPEFHEAIMREENNEYEDGTVIEEYRKGFLLNEKLLRPAMVKVSVSMNGSSEPQDEPVAEET